jgi:hypothetical protein
MSQRDGWLGNTVYFKFYALLAAAGGTFFGLVLRDPSAQHSNTHSSQLRIIRCGELIRTAPILKLLRE